MHSNLLLRKPTDSKLYVEDVFSTWLYTGNGSTQTITNGIDLAGKGGLVWLKRRELSADHQLFDTIRGTGNLLASNATGAQSSGNTDTLQSFNASGFNVGSNYGAGASGGSYASWTFRKAPKFFDVVTYTGNGTNNRTISHSLGAVPGMIIVKSTSATGSWYVYHRALPTAQDEYLVLNSTAASVTTGGVAFGAPTSTTFMLEASGGNGRTNATGVSYVAYLFAHDTTADGVIQCGSYSGAVSNPVITLGWEPQFILRKRNDSTGNWEIVDNMRGMPVGSVAPSLQPNLSSVESSSSQYLYPTATGFEDANSTNGATYIYLAIRRGPMRTPTDATKVFSVSTRTGASGASTLIPSGGLSFSPDLLISTPQANSNSFNYRYFINRLADQFSLQSESTGAEQFGTSNPLATFAGYQNQVWVGPAGVINQQDAMIDFFLRRAPSFFDVICYTGTGSARTVSHNLGVAPELMIVKGRNLVSSAWRVYASSLGATKFLNLHTTGAATTQSDIWNNTSPTSSVFTVGTDNSVNSSGNTIVAYLFASCFGVSKVGSYTGNGSSLNIDCGFTNGARFVLIKRTDSTGNSFVWNSARGIVAANDPYISLNTTNAEITTNDSLDPLSAGFTVNQLTATNVNVNAATYIYLAIA